MTPTEEPTEHRALLAKLRQIGQRRADADRAREAASNELHVLVRAAVDAGVPVARVAREAQLSRQQVYNIVSGRRGGQDR